MLPTIQIPTLKKIAYNPKGLSKAEEAPSPYPTGVQRAWETCLEDAAEVSPELQREIRRRMSLLVRSQDDLHLQQRLLEKARQFPVWWVNTFVWTYDPRVKPATLPFLLWQKQAEYILWRRQCYLDKEGGIVEKSRDVGATWLNVSDQVHHWIFDSGYKGTFASRKEQYVDRLGDPDSILEKARIIIRNLPGWMLNQDDWTGGFMKIVNVRNGSTITGESGDQIGRGGRSSLLDIDEAAFLAQQQKVDAAVSQNTNVIFRTSTPNGPTNDFAQKRKSGRFKVFTIHKRSDPRVDDAWFEKQRTTLEPWVFAQEIDIDYAASVEGTIIPAAWVQAAVRFRVSAFGLRAAGLDIADGGEDINVLIPRRGPVVEMPITREQGNTTQTAWWAYDKAIATGIELLIYDPVGVGSGVSGTLLTRAQDKGLPFDFVAFSGGIYDPDKEWPEFGGRTSKELFKNLRSQFWWLLRTRFEKTYEVVNGTGAHDPAECICLPDHAELISQLSTPKVFYDESGCIQVESKKQMKARGIKSPDFADALMMSFYQPPPKVKRGSWLRKV